MVREITAFLTSLTFFTRIPGPKNLAFDQNIMNRAGMYFPLIGWIVGLAGAGLFWGSLWIFPQSIAVLISMIGTILLTGAFHEDGFADFCDGFGGGWTKEEILAIMKDSRIGVFGTLGIVLMLALKFALLWEMTLEKIPWALITAHSLSRFFSIAYLLTHSRVGETSKGGVKILYLKRISGAACFGILPLILFYPPTALWILIPLSFLHYGLGRYFSKWIDGCNGDCFGAAQQIAEVMIYAYLGFGLK